MSEYNRYGNILLLICVLAVAVVFCGCSSMYDLMQADPAPVTKFTPSPEKLETKPATFPFDRFWYEKDVDWNRYNKIKILPVDTSNLLEDSLWQSLNSDYLFADKEVKKIAEYMRKKFIEELKAAKKSGLTVTDTVDNKTLVLQLSLTQLVPTKAALNATWTTVGIIVPFASTANILNSGCVAFEGQIKDGGTGKVLAMFTDREKDAGAVINIRDYSYYAGAYGTIDRWAKSFAEMTEAEDANKVEKPFPFYFILL